MAEIIKSVLGAVSGIFSSIVGFFKRLLKLGDDEPTATDGDDKDVEVVAYYGCPNSSRVKKLQLEKKLYK